MNAPRATLAGVLLALLAAPGCLAPRYEAGPAGTTAAAPAPAQPVATEFRVVSFNIYNRPWDRRRRIPRTVDVLRHLRGDIVAMQEVAYGLLSFEDPSRTAAAALDLTRAAILFDDTWILLRSGNATLARYPLLDQGWYAFDANRPFNRKGLLYTLYGTPAGELLVVNIHLAAVARGPIKDRQIQELDLFLREQRHGRPLILVGDFNEEFPTRRLTRLRDRLQARTLFESNVVKSKRNTYAGSYPRRCDDKRGERIDDVWVVDGEKAALAFKSGGVYVPAARPYPSDHCPIVTTITMTPR